jgi:hypothetical protein
VLAALVAVTGHEDVVGEQVDEGVEVGGLPGTDEPGGDGVLGDGAGGRVAAVAQGGAGSFVDAGDGVDGRVEHGVRPGGDGRGVESGRVLMAGRGGDVRGGQAQVAEI